MKTFVFRDRYLKAADTRSYGCTMQRKGGDRRTMRKRSTLTISILALCGSVLAQGTKTLLFVRPVGHDPIRIVKVMEGSTEVQSDGNEFPNKLVQEYALIAGDDWIKDLSVVIQNVSNKTIAYIAVNGDLFETADWQAELVKHKTSLSPDMSTTR